MSDVFDVCSCLVFTVQNTRDIKHKSNFEIIDICSIKHVNELFKCNFHQFHLIVPTLKYLPEINHKTFTNHSCFNVLMKPLKVEPPNSLRDSDTESSNRTRTRPPKTQWKVSGGNSAKIAQCLTTLALQFASVSKSQGPNQKYHYSITGGMEYSEFLYNTVSQSV